jgi:bifunctional ADP-heptose synthase (sugar kinase/adenylyltransferase)
MKEEKFKVINYIRKLILEIEKELSNFPKKEIEIKNRIRTNSYDLLELAYEANTTSNIENKKILLEKIIAKIKVIDFLINLSYDKMLINNKKYMKLGEKMEDIIKYTAGWVKSIK